jgi:hypothetical protein
VRLPTRDYVALRLTFNFQPKATGGPFGTDEVPVLKYVGVCGAKGCALNNNNTSVKVEYILCKYVMTIDISQYIALNLN